YYNGTTSKAGLANIRGVKENATQGDYASAMVFDTRANGGNQTERMRITSAGNLGIGTSTPAAKLEVNGTSQFDGNITITGTNSISGYGGTFSGAGGGVVGQDTNVGGVGLIGSAPATTGPGVGVEGVSKGDNAAAVLAKAISLTGLTNGVHAISKSSGGLGVFAEATSLMGVTYGVQGNSSSPNGTGVFGVALANSGPATGVQGQTASASGNGIYGVNTALTGGNGIYGYSAATSGTANGVYGVGIGTTSNGLSGNATSGSGFANGVYAQTASPNGNGVYGVDNASTGGTGVTGVTNATSGGNGVYGQSSNSTSNGVYGLNNGTGSGGTGVTGQANASGGTGTSGISTAASGFATGLYGQAANVNATAELLNNTASGNIIIGQAAGVNKFRVDGTGKGFFDGGTQSSGADFAESMAVRGGRSLYEPGDLLVIDPTGHRRLAISRTPYSSHVAGIFSTKPGVLATPHNMDDGQIKDEVPLAIVGIVPCKVTTQNGPIQVGDLLVSSSLPGYAMKGTKRARMLGAVVGKALEPLPNGRGVIQVLVTLQ
ncbi:MAG TPA: hypothetical protein VG028_05180, partial [Terriglobia bacterium]|nr:hypothetical protein [Terriglobia bacterium]